MKSNELPAPRKVGGEENERPSPQRLAVFIASELNRNLCDIQDALMTLGLAAETWLAAKHEEAYYAALSAAGLAPLPTYEEWKELDSTREALALISATAHLAYNTISRLAQPDYQVIDSVPPGPLVTLVAAGGE